MISLTCVAVSGSCASRHLSYDKMAGFLACYGNPDALKVARELDSKVEALLIETAG
jgi:hypothetical protein